MREGWVKQVLYHKVMYGELSIFSGEDTACFSTLWKHLTLSPYMAS